MLSKVSKAFWAGAISLFIVAIILNLFLGVNFGLTLLIAAIVGVIVAFVIVKPKL